MKHHHLHLHLRLIHLFRHGFATKYNSRVVVESDNGRSFVVKVNSLTFQTDVRGFPLPHCDLISSEPVHKPTATTPIPPPPSPVIANHSPTFSPSNPSHTVKPNPHKPTAITPFKHNLWFSTGNEGGVELLLGGVRFRSDSGAPDMGGGGSVREQRSFQLQQRRSIQVEALVENRSNLGSMKTRSR